VPAVAPVWIAVRRIEPTGCVVESAPVYFRQPGLLLVGRALRVAAV
jgi:hypothetical protein